MPISRFSKGIYNSIICVKLFVQRKEVFSKYHQKYPQKFLDNRSILVIVLMVAAKGVSYPWQAAGLFCGGMKMGQRTNLLVLAVLSIAATTQASIFQTASPYSDTQGDSLGSTNGGRDIVGATITNDATNLYITIELNPTTTTNASGTETPASIATSGYNYCIGITSGPGAGGDTSTSSDHGNKYGRMISIDPSMGGTTDWIGIFGYGTGTSPGSTTNPYTSYGFNDYVYGTPSDTVDPAGVWTTKENVASGEPMSMLGGDTNYNAVTITIPMADFANNLSLTLGSTFDFDIYTTGGSGNQTAYDSLADQSPTQTPLSYNATAQYNGTVLDSYTIVPEPASACILAMGGIALAASRKRKA
jgi:hypothetical protein